MSDEELQELYDTKEEIENEIEELENPPTANDVIPFKQFRKFINDKPEQKFETIIGDGSDRIFDLMEQPILEPTNDNDYKFDVEFDEIEVLSYKEYENLEEDEEENGGEIYVYEVDFNSGLLIFENPIPEEVKGVVNYYRAELTDNDIEEALNQALRRHDPDMTWENFPRKYYGDIQLLAGSICFYMLASESVQSMNVQVESVEVSGSSVSKRYFNMAQRLEDEYKDGSSGNANIEMIPVTRRSLETGVLVRQYEDIEEEEEIKEDELTLLYEELEEIEEEIAELEDEEEDGEEDEDE